MFGFIKNYISVSSGVRIVTIEGTYNDYDDNPNLTGYQLDSPESPKVEDNNEEEETENQEKQNEEDFEKSIESEHQINENVSLWIKQFRVRLCWCYC